MHYWFFLRVLRVSFEDLTFVLCERNWQCEGFSIMNHAFSTSWIKAFPFLHTTFFRQNVLHSMKSRSYFVNTCTWTYFLSFFTLDHEKLWTLFFLLWFGVRFWFTIRTTGNIWFPDICLHVWHRIMCFESKPWVVVKENAEYPEQIGFIYAIVPILTLLIIPNKS